MDATIIIPIDNDIYNRHAENGGVMKGSLPCSSICPTHGGFPTSSVFLRGILKWIPRGSAPWM